ncbi:MAG: ABC transporter substrate-binding protein [Brumimicrobium sp.]|nr:ABC transporter substrate-binding protein [Brumimicrobium sp.]
MKTFTGIIFFLILASLLSCSTDSGPSVKEDTVVGEKGDTLKNEYAEAFRIIKFSDHFEIEVIDPQEGSVAFSYAIGKRKPGKEFIEKELNKVIALSSTHLGMMEKLNLLDRIVGISGEQYLCSEFLKKRVEEKKVHSVGDIGMSDVEGYIAVKPDLIIYSGFDTKAPILNKMEMVGLQTFTNYDWKETHPLGRAEWLKVFGLLFNKEEVAFEAFERIKESYLLLKSKASNVQDRPDVLVGTVYGDIFNAPAGNSYMARLLSDANCNYVYKNTDGVGSISLSMERVITENENTEWWLNVSAQSKSEVLLLSDKFKLMRSFRQGNMYSYYHRVNCFWERSAVEPHLILEDLCKILHPSEFGESGLKYYSGLE